MAFRPDVLSGLCGSVLILTRGQSDLKALVPREGKCDTIEGELLRAINRIIYRYYNDGDHLSDEPVKSAYAYLSKCNVIYVPKETTGKEYEAELEKSLTSVLVYIINRGGKYRRNEIDMMDYRKRMEHLSRLPVLAADTE